MADVVEIMYFLATMVPPPVNRQLYQSATGTALGKVTLGGIIWNGPGIGRDLLRRYPSYALVYSLGNGEYRNAQRQLTLLRPGDLVVVLPGVPHQYGPSPTGPWNEIYVVFDGPIFELWQHRGLLEPGQPIHHLEPIEHWRRRLEEIVAPRVSALERITRVQSFLADMLSLSPRADADEQWVRRARALLEADLERELYVQDVAQRLGMSAETFRKKFVRLTGSSPWHYRLVRLIDQACRLVHEGELTSKEIAARLGFNDEFHFSRRFKRITGYSPRQFRALVPRSR